MDIVLVSRLITLGFAIAVAVILVAVDYYSPLCCTKKEKIEFTPHVIYINEDGCIIELAFDIKNNKWNKKS